MCIISLFSTSCVSVLLSETEASVYMSETVPRPDKGQLCFWKKQVIVIAVGKYAGFLASCVWKNWPQYGK